MKSLNKILKVFAIILLLYATFVISSYTLPSQLLIDSNDKILLPYNSEYYIYTLSMCNFLIFFFRKYLLDLFNSPSEQKARVKKELKKVWKAQKKLRKREKKLRRQLFS